MLLCQGWIFWYVPNLLTSFEESGFVFTQDAGDDHLVSGFPSRGIFPCIVVESMCFCKKKGLGLPVLPSF